MIIECLDWDKKIDYCYKHLEPIEDKNRICPKCLLDNRSRITIIIEDKDSVTEINSKVIIVSDE
ncbi:hypothetical protein GW933_03910 [Candidatus Falkowbacteria bacterium]|uniref:Uncharacterized protein n=1 Tax=Candidatus Buchananbacteria bacterium CG10_big_fil_rev_8_21_14_0_10_33_19 TaxID=1974525 RepID=A0A2H0W5B5_9BACT|nr:hypothetical protein [Candidatus Falkowbacteria bacterium]PIS06542.1 MAG: hypothetical protein COT80_00275 [Candidatus Buchananbacteria bacterium CG10_big_fil_rev_8_21_14_0_10_33_19]